MYGMTTRIERMEQQAKALELRLQGASLRAISERMGLPLPTVQRRVVAALRDLRAETPEEVRRTVETRYDGLLSRLYALLESGKLSPRDEVSVINSIGQVEDRRVRLLGVSVPSTVVLQLEQDSGLR